VTPQGSLTTLITMDDMSPFPKGRLLQDEPGVFYGVADTFGVIYRLTVEFGRRHRRACKTPGPCKRAVPVDHRPPGRFQVR
jgi:hypothetical protein